MLVLACLLLGAFLGFCLHALLSVAHEADMCMACLHRTDKDVVPC
jgi:hypothetical protein